MICEQILGDADQTDVACVTTVIVVDLLKAYGCGHFFRHIPQFKQGRCNGFPVDREHVLVHKSVVDMAVGFLNATNSFE